MHKVTGLRSNLIKKTCRQPCKHKARENPRTNTNVSAKIVLQHAIAYLCIYCVTSRKKTQKNKKGKRKKKHNSCQVTDFGIFHILPFFRVQLHCVSMQIRAS